MDSNYGVNGVYTDPLNNSPLLEAPPSATDSPLANLNPRQLPYPTIRRTERRPSVQIPSLNGVEISSAAVDQLRELHALANRNATPETPLDQRQVSIIALGHLEEGNQLMIDGFDVRRHLGDTQRTVLRGSKWGSSLLSLVGAIVGEVLYTRDNAAGAYGIWLCSLFAAWPLIESQIIDRLCKSPDPVFREQEFDPAPAGQYRV